MMDEHERLIATRGWALLSAVERNEQYPDTFEIPSEKLRQNLAIGVAAKLLFDIETKENGVTMDRGVDRMWVIITQTSNGNYTGVLDSDPGYAKNLQLARGDQVSFHANHICGIAQPPNKLFRLLHKLRAFLIK